MKIIFAQGNPEPEYAGTRHNIGFQILTALATSHDVTFSAKPKFQADIAELSVDGEKVLLIKPTTYYNETGTAARALLDFYKCDPATDLLVIHDDLALPFGTIRTRERGSDAGNNGIKSLNAHIGEDYKRIRIGIWSDLRDHIDDVNFVLSKFSKEESEKLPEAIKKAHQIVDEFIQNQFEVTTH